MSRYTDLVAEKYSHRHPGIITKLQAFDNEHLSLELKEITDVFKEASLTLVELVTKDSPWLTNALQKLWEAKNEAVMAKPEEKK